MVAADWKAVLGRFAGLRVAVAGDVILDRYWWGQASRLSPEAPVPVVRKSRATCVPGGAANTAANLRALGARVDLFGVVGVDPEAAELRAALDAQGIVAHLLADAGRPTTTKTRIVAAHQQIVRVDDESTHPLPVALAEEAAEELAQQTGAGDALVLSDYAKGYLTPALLQTVIARANASGKRIFVDPKGDDFRRYQGATLLKPNRKELELLTRIPAENHSATIVAGCALSAAMPGTVILVTEGSDGMTLFADGRERTHIASTPQQVFDVTGAGDTVLAVLTLAVAAGADFGLAMEMAAAAASIAIGLMGTAAVSATQLEGALELRKPVIQ